MASLIRMLLPAVLLLLFVAGPLLAANEGQEDLDKATEAKLSAETAGDLSQVIRLTESALAKGLDEANAQFAKKLLASTLIERATELRKGILANLTSLDELRDRRKSLLADLEKAVSLDPKQTQAYLLIAQVNLFIPEGDAKQAKEALDKALELGIEDPATHSKALVWRASVQDQPEKKMADFDEAVRLAPNDAATVRSRGLALAEIGKLEAALADVDKAIELDPDDAATYDAKAIVLAQLKRYDDALLALENARKLSPNSVTLLEQEAGMHVQQGKSDAALEDLDRALKLDPKNLKAMLLQATIYQEKGDIAKALANVDRALKLEPNLPLAVRMRASLLAGSQRVDEAIADLENYRKVNPKDSLAMLLLGVFYSAQKKSPQAIDAFSASLAEEPGDWRALQGRADAYLNIGKHAEAIADYEKAVKLQPKNESLLNNFAWVLATSPDDKLRDGKRAITLATEACKLTDYKQAYILSTLAASYAEIGDFDTAIKWSSKAVEIGDPKHDDSLKKELETYQAKKPMRERFSEKHPAGEDEDSPKKPSP